MALPGVSRATQKKGRVDHHRVASFRLVTVGSPWEAQNGWVPDDAAAAIDQRSSVQYSLTRRQHWATKII